MAKELGKKIEKSEYGDANKEVTAFNTTKKQCSIHTNTMIL